uniref:Uncharacterized protein n=1 Tax=viral metagenome TaxID=1070528 RepID=A0A6C0JY72_9ZZZZ
MSWTVYQCLEREIANRQMSENDKIDILDAYKACIDTLETLYACIRALERCGLPEEDPEYKKLKDTWSKANDAHDIARDNFDAIDRRLVR